MRLVILVSFTISLTVGVTANSVPVVPLPQDYGNSITSIAQHNHAEVLERSERSHLSGNLVEVKNFYLWTRKTPHTSSETLDPTEPKAIDNTTFAPRKTYVIIHGFLGWGTEDWIVSLKDKLLNLYDCNVISVDWPAGSNVLEYYTIVHRVIYVAQDTTFLFKTLIGEKGLHVKDVHVIGHSLGAHVAGLSSKSLPHQYGRITGLDPAGLTYHNVNPSERLDRTDATYVDIIHTNGCNYKYNPWGSCYGIDENIGDADFWPNGGKYQPACHGGEVEGDVGCDHMMSYKYFLESVDYDTYDTLFLARNCSDWDTYTLGNCSCGDYAQYMGLYSNIRLAGKFYLKTNASAPYAERDGVCSPGSTVKNGMIAIVASAGSGIFAVIAIVIFAVVFMRNRKVREVNSGLLIEEEAGYEDDDDLLQCTDDELNPHQHSSNSDDDGLIT